MNRPLQLLKVLVLLVLALLAPPGSVPAASQPEDTVLVRMPASAYERLRVDASPPVHQASERAIDHGSFAWLELAARRIPGFDLLPDADPRSIEMSLLQGISQDLRRLGRDPLGPGVLIDYLWRCQIAARNRALFLNLGKEQEEVLNETLVIV